MVRFQKPLLRRSLSAATRQTPAGVRSTGVAKCAAASQHPGERPRAGWPCQRLPGCPCERACASQRRLPPAKKRSGHTGKARVGCVLVSNRAPPANRCPPPTRPPWVPGQPARAKSRGRAGETQADDDLARGKPGASREMLRRHSRCRRCVRTKRGCPCILFQTAGQEREKGPQVGKRPIQEADFRGAETAKFPSKVKMVPPGRIEPPTPRF